MNYLKALKTIKKRGLSKIKGVSFFFQLKKNLIQPKLLRVEIDFVAKSNGVTEPFLHGLAKKWVKSMVKVGYKLMMKVPSVTKS